MILSIIIAAFLYMLVQFVWYSPWVFGTPWQRLQNTIEEAFPAQPTVSTQASWRTVQTIILPALMMSVVTHILIVLFIHLGTRIVVTLAILLFLLSAGTKYRSWHTATTDTRVLWYISDGALAVSMAVLTIFVLWSRGRFF